MEIKTKGLIIREQIVSEGDSLVTILTKFNGVIKAFVKGAKNIRNKNFSSVQLFCYSEFSIYKGRNKYIINESSLIDSFFRLRRDIEKLALTQYFCEIIFNLVQEGVNSEEILRFTLNSFHRIANTKLNISVTKSIFEFRIISMSGYMPNLISCYRCVSIRGKEIFFSCKEGGIVCSECLVGGDKELIKINFSVLSALRHIVYSDFNKIFSFELGKENQQLLSFITEKYLLNFIEKDLKTLKFYKSL